MTTDQPELFVRLPALPENVAVVRHALGDMAAARGADDRARGAIAVAVTEAVANVVVHAYQDGGVFEIEASVADDALGVIVRDHGVGLQSGATSGGLGAGLRIIGALAQAFSIRRHDGATEVHMEFLLRPTARPL